MSSDAAFVFLFIMTIAAICAGVFIVPAAINWAYPLPLVKLFNGIPFAFNFTAENYTTEVITPYHTNQTNQGTIIE